MRYLGNKESLLPFIDEVLATHEVKSAPDNLLCACDPFTGTTSVARHLKRLGWRVVSGDIMAYSYAFQHAYVGLNDSPPFAGLLNAGALDSDLNLAVPLHRVIAYLNNLRGVEGFIYATYSPDGVEGRRYFTSANALRIDAIRQTIKLWWEMGWLTEAERYLLVAALIEAVSKVANVAGTYAAYLKRWDPRAHKPLALNVPQIIHTPHEHSVNLADANDLAARTACDLLYVDPPYNTRQYSANYHLLETLALGDQPDVRGIAGLPTDYELRITNYELQGLGSKVSKLSPYYRPRQAEEALSQLVAQSQAERLLMSYNSEGIIPHDSIMEILSQRGKVTTYECEYRRFRSDGDGDNRQYKSNTVREMLYWVEQ